MSYKNVILSDYPIAYHPLDDFSSGSSALDYSGCENDGSYTGIFIENHLPIVIGNSASAKITNTTYIEYSVTNDYTATTTTSQFGTLTSSDNDFTLEAWIYPKFTTTNETVILADTTEDVGLFYDKGNITFKINAESLSYTLSNLDKVHYIVATYSPTLMCIYVDGEIVSTKSLSGFTFTNTTLSLASGPTLNAGDYFLINSVGIYRYALSGSQIQNHYLQALGLSPIQIVDPDSGEIFDIYDDNISTQFIYSYPGNKSWEHFITDDLYYNDYEQSLSIKKSTGSKTVVLTDYISLLYAAVLDSSKIEWDGTSGVTVEVSVDGSTYQECQSGQSIPQFKISSFDTNKQIYLKITLTTTDSSKYLPKISTLQIKFYNNQIAYASNSSSYISSLEGVAGVSVYDMTIGNNKYPILSRNARNGIRTITNSGFYLNTTSSVKTVEFFYTPYALTDSKLISTASSGSYSASSLSWVTAGTISKTNIQAIYINGINKSSETSVSNLFKVGQLHHVVIVFTSAVGQQLKFNNPASGAVAGLFQNIAIYTDAFTLTQASNHYDLYRYGSISTITDQGSPSITVTENSVNYYDNDWIVVQNV